MKYVLLGIIKLYWIFFPKNKRKRCIFKESCSNYIYRIINDKGIVLGIFAFKKRYEECRPGYTIYKYTQNNTFELSLVNGRIIQTNKISKRLLPPINYNYIAIDKIHN